MKKLFIIAVVISSFIIQNVEFANAQPSTSALSGQILLQVESVGEAWYVNPSDNNRYYLGKPADAFDVMRQLGLGIKHSTLTTYLNDKFPVNLSGKIILDVENNGEAYYIYPKDRKGYYLGKPADAFNVMRKKGLGISNKDLEKIKQNKTKQEDINNNQSINLVKNNKWNIFVKAPLRNDFNMYLYFDINRNGENMNIKTYQQDNNTGELKESLLYNYSVNFDNKFFEYKEDVYLLIKRHWYDYPTLKVGSNSQKYYIPIKIDTKKVKGILRLDREYRDNQEDGINFEIEIREKENTNIECLIKGFTNSKGKYYYTEDSDHFNYPSNFKCFSNEKNAISDGYTKSFDN